MDVSDGIGAVTYGYDKTGLRTRVSVPGRDDQLLAYDRNANLISRQSGRNQAAVTTYDPHGRVLIRSLYDPAGQIAALFHGEEVAGVEAIPVDRLLVRYEYYPAGAGVRAVTSECGETAIYNTPARDPHRACGGRDSGVRLTYDAQIRPFHHRWHQPHSPVCPV